MDIAYQNRHSEVARDMDTKWLWVRDGSGKACWDVRRQGCWSTAGEEQPDESIPEASYNQGRASDHPHLS